MSTEPSPSNTWRRWRKARGLSQQHVADMSGVSQPVISSVERGEVVSMESMRRLVDYYGVSWEEAVAVLPDLFPSLRGDSP